MVFGRRSYLHNKRCGREILGVDQHALDEVSPGVTDVLGVLWNRGQLHRAARGGGVGAGPGLPVAADLERRGAAAAAGAVAHVTEVELVASDRLEVQRELLVSRYVRDGAGRHRTGGV